MSPRIYEEEPQVSDYRRASYEEVDDHELTLSTPAILGLFFALVLVCGCFFGLGYAMGHRTAPATPQVFENATAPATDAPKPTAGSAAPDTSSVAAVPSPSSVDATASGPQTTTVPLNANAAANTSEPSAVSAAPKPATVATSPTPQSAATAAPGSYVVQVAAVSSQDVANILLSTLQKKGYAVAVHHESQDNLLHVQIGPFSDRKDAEAMRQRVLADGFNAIVK